MVCCMLAAALLLDVPMGCSAAGSERRKPPDPSLGDVISRMRHVLGSRRLERKGEGRPGRGDLLGQVMALLYRAMTLAATASGVDIC